MAAVNRPVVSFQPEVYREMQCGINQVANAIRPTLGPLSRMVAVSTVLDGKTPELLDNGAAIARRIVELPNRTADAGAMLLRHILWRVYQQAGDGTATAAVLFQSVYNQGVRYVQSGGNAMKLRSHLDHGAALILDALDAKTVRVEGKHELAHVAESVCHDPELAKLLGEIFDIIGEYGQLDIRTGYGRALDREYVEGMYWERGILSREMLRGTKANQAELIDAAVLISDLNLEDPQDLLPILTEAMQANLKGILIIANEFSDTVKSFLLANRPPEQFQAIAVRTPGSALQDKIAFLEDMAVITGGQPIHTATGQSLHSVRLRDLGQARRIWANTVHFGIVAGKGDPHALRQHIMNLRLLYDRTQNTDLRLSLRQRLGKLVGGSATLFTGGVTQLEINNRKTLGEHTADALRGALRSGIVPGGGVALLNCKAALSPMSDGSADLDPDEQAAYRVLCRAVEAPIRTIIQNAGFDGSQVLAEIYRAGQGYGFDVVNRKIADTAEVGIYDISEVLKTAVITAIRGAALALTIDVLVQHKQPEQMVEP